MSRFSTGTIVVVALLLVGGVSGAYYLSNSTPTSGEAPFSASNGPAGAVTGGVDVNATVIQKDASTTWIRSSGGNVTMTGPASGYVRFDGNIEGTWTNTSAIDTAGGTVTIDPDDKQQADVGGSIDTLDWQHSMAADDGKVDFVYSGASGSSVVTFYNLPASTQLAAVDADNNTVLDVQTTDSNGNATFTMANSEHDVTLQTQDGEPEVTNVRPSGNLSSPPSEISADIDDADFPDDNVTVYMYWNGTLEGAESVKSASTVSTALSGDPVAGEHTVKVAAQDAYGSWTNKTTTFNVPDELFIYNETQPSQLIKGTNSTVSVKFFADDQIITRNTTDGSINLTGLPVNQKLIVMAEVDGFYTRRTIIDTLYDQQRMYLLNESYGPVAETRFTVDDRTGQFDDPTVLIEKPIERNGSTKWQRIVGDEVGVAGLTTNLDKDARYRIIVRQDGNSRMLGSYTNPITETVELQVGSLTFEYGNVSGYRWDASHHNKSGSHEVRFNFSDPDKKTENLQVVVHERGNESNQLVSKTYAGPVGNVSFVEPLTTNQSEKAWVVNFTADRGGQQISGEEVVGAKRVLNTGLAPLWLHTISVGLLIVVAGLFGGLNARIGAVVVPLLAGVLWMVGMLPAGVGAGVIILALGIAILYNVRSSGGAPV